MIQQSSNFNLSMRPRRAFYVRKRKQGGQTYLINKVDLFRLDDLGEAIWSRSDGETSVAEMVAQLSASFPQVETVELMQAVARSILFLAQRRLIEPLEEPAVLPPALERAAFNDSLAELMQAYHHDPALSWQEGLPRLTTERVQTRFYRICYEAYWASVADKRWVLNELTFRNRWKERFLIDRETTVRAFADKFGIKSWRFKPSENRIIMVRERSVYEGDVDHRR